MKAPYLLFLALLIINISSGAAQFDHFWLVLVWPQGYCLEHNCARLESYFVIHGLWPVNSRGKTLEGTYRLDLKTRRALYDDGHLKNNLTEYWLSLGTKEDDALPSFWIYEWKKHGSAQSLLDPIDYFQRAVQLTKYADLLSTLADKGVVANGSSYPRHMYMTAIQAKTGHLPILGCVNKDGQRQLKEVTLCVGMQARNFRSCNYGLSSITSCKTKNDKIKFPEYIAGSRSRQLRQFPKALL